MATAQQGFAVVPPGRAAWLTLAALGIGLPLVVISAALAGRDPGSARAVLVTLTVMGLLMLVLLGLIRRRSVRIEAGQLVVRAALYTLRLAPGGIDLAHARIVDLDERRELRPRWKTNGYALPGFYAGHFRGPGMRERLFCLLTDRRRVLVLPLHDGRRLLLSLEHPQALLEALRAMHPH